ncbi:hypothetical protein MINT15_00180 [Saccharomonospora viridis]|uniref:Uncharacterized protein n=1 Tax=Saccharomonospora viridis TaxID=1852 RepID=A0A837DDR5_9PSEU|nr:hypothetical protein MINT15_00180 [Saccharomonospora viridis]
MSKRHPAYCIPHPCAPVQRLNGFGGLGGFGGFNEFNG